MIVKRADQASRFPTEKINWGIAAALFLTPEASRAVHSPIWGTNLSERAVKLIDSKGRTIGYWRREP
jgi:hypothetical protein